MTKAEVARLLHAYMAFRAAREGVDHTLPVSFYRKQLDAGICVFFGVIVGPDGLILDKQQPEMFAEWAATKH